MTMQQPNGDFAWAADLSGFTIRAPALIRKHRVHPRRIRLAHRGVRVCHARTRMEEEYALQGVTFARRGKSPIAFTKSLGSDLDPRDYHNKWAARKVGMHNNSI